MTFRATVRAYDWRIWAGWVGVLVGLALPAIFVAAIAGTGSGSARSAIFASIWIFGWAGTVIYFEAVNNRRRSSADAETGDGTALMLAGAGVFIGLVLVLFAGPLVLLLAYLAWRRLRKIEKPYAAGLASAVVAFAVGTADTIYLLLVLTGHGF